MYLCRHFVNSLEVEGFRARGHERDVEGDEARHFGGVQEVEALGEVGAPIFMHLYQFTIRTGGLQDCVFLPVMSHWYDALLIGAFCLHNLHDIAHHSTDLELLGIGWFGAASVA